MVVSDKQLSTLSNFLLQNYVKRWTLCLPNVDRKPYFVTVADRQFTTQSNSNLNNTAQSPFIVSILKIHTHESRSYFVDKLEAHKHFRHVSSPITSRVKSFRNIKKYGLQHHVVGTTRHNRRLLFFHFHFVNGQEIGCGWKRGGHTNIFQATSKKSDSKTKKGQKEGKRKDTTQKRGKKRNNGRSSQKKRKQLHESIGQLMEVICLLSD